MIKKFDFDLKEIEQEFKKQANEMSDLSTRVCETISLYQNNKSKFESIFKEYRNIEFLYDYKFRIVSSNLVTKTKTNKTSKIHSTRKDITKEFYDGFEIS